MCGTHVQLLELSTRATPDATQGVGVKPIQDAWGMGGRTGQGSRELLLCTASVPTHTGSHSTHLPTHTLTPLSQAIVCLTQWAGVVAELPVVVNATLQQGVVARGQRLKSQ